MFFYLSKDVLFLNMNNFVFLIREKIFLNKKKKNFFNKIDLI